MMFFNACFEATGGPRQSTPSYSKYYLAAHGGRANRERSCQVVRVISKCLLCFLILAPPVFGQFSAPLPADHPCTNVAPAEKLPGDRKAFAGSSPCKDEAGPAPATAVATPFVSQVGGTGQGQQTKRIMYIIPNFHSVSTDAHLPAQSPKEKLINATEDSFDYSSFIFVGMLAGIGQAKNSTPEFGQGAAGYGRYFWHVMVDQTDENYWVEAFMPIVLRQDTRYYTLERGSFVKRSMYALSRAAITRTDGGLRAPNYSEIIGSGAAAGISNLYYPESERTWTKTGQRWATNVGLDVLGLVFKEFWPDVNHKVFHQN